MFSTMNADKEAHLSSCVCGYHIYNAIWSAVTEELQYAREIENAKDGYTKSPFYEVQMYVVGHYLKVF